MGNDWFRFKRFVVHQSEAAMKVGTDGVLLGAWARMSPATERVLDIGTGTGVIALMMAQRTESSAARIDAVEIDPAAAGQAAANAGASPWADRIRVCCGDIASFSADAPYDTVVANPPWFEDSLRCPDGGRSRARHTDSLPFGVLAECAARLLRPDGAFSVILPAESASAFADAAYAAGLGTARKCLVATLPQQPPKRILLEMVPLDRCPARPESDLLTIQERAGGEYTAPYHELTKDFYLKF